MPDVLYFVSDSDGKWELSDAERKIGPIEQVGMEFTIKPTQGSILEGMEVARIRQIRKLWKPLKYIPVLLVSRLHDIPFVR